MKRLLREPLLHFLVIGAVLFAIYEYSQRGVGGEPSRQITITPADLKQLAASFQSQQSRPPTPDELNALVECKVQEEVLYREALTIGLDKDDAVVKSRLAEKMQFLAEDVFDVHEPTTAELKSWFAKNSDRFAEPSRATFRHLFFSADRRDKAARSDAEKSLSKLSGEPKDSKMAASLADSFAYQDYYSDSPPDELNSAFGPQVAAAIAKLKVGSWQGPIESTHGWHLVFVDAFTPARTPPFDEIESDVKAAWLEDQKVEAWQKAYDRMRLKYSVSLPLTNEPL